MKNTIDFKKMGFKTIEEYDKFLNDRMEFMMDKIKFEELKQACISNYKEYLEVCDDVDDADIEINSANNIDELVNILDGMGFNGDEAYKFILNSILD